MSISPEKKKDTPTISELCRLDKKPIQSAAKAVCSDGLYVQAVQQLKHLPSSFGQPPVSSPNVLDVTNKPTVKAPRSKVQRGQAPNKTLFDTRMEIWSIALYHLSLDGACTSKQDELHNPDINGELSEPRTREGNDDMLF